MDYVQQLINAYTGQVLNVDGADSGQCTAVPHRLEQLMGLPLVYGNAIDMYANAPEGDYIKTPNEAANFPVAGDTIIWHTDPRLGVGQYGHVAVVISANANTVTVFEQNDTIGGGNGTCRVHTFPNYEGVTGWIHPRILDVPAEIIEVATPPITAPVEATPDPVPTVTEPIPDPEPEPVTNTPTEPQTPVVTEGMATAEDVPPAPKYDFVAFTDGVHHMLLQSDTEAVNLDTGEVVKSLTQGEEIPLSGTMSKDGVDYYRGTSGAYNGIPQSAFATGNSSGPVTVRIVKIIKEVEMSAMTVEATLGKRLGSLTKFFRTRKSN